MSKPKELQKRIEQLRKEIANVKINSGFDSASEISKKQSEIFVLAFQLAEVSTRRIVHLTWVIIALTAILVITIFFEFPKIAIQFNQKPYFSTQKTNKANSNNPSNDKNNFSLKREVIPHPKIKK